MNEHIDFRLEQPDRNKTVDKPYFNIPYKEAKWLGLFNCNDYIYVEEKIDGSNTSARIDADTGKLRAFGRRFELSPKFTNMGAYKEIVKIEDKIRETVGADYTLYFEWLVHHHVKYNEYAMGKLYLISVKDNSTNKYIGEAKVYDIADELGIPHAPLLYEGYFQSWETLQAYVGQSRLGAKPGEGIVIKAYDEQFGQKMLKIVHADFIEKMNYDVEARNKKIKQTEDKTAKAAEIVTDARIRKALFRMIEDGQIASIEPLSEEDRVTANKAIGQALYEDCHKEESEFMENFGKDFMKYAVILGREFIGKL